MILYPLLISIRDLENIGDIEYFSDVKIDDEYWTKRIESSTRGIFVVCFLRLSCGW